MPLQATIASDTTCEGGICCWEHRYMGVDVRHGVGVESKSVMYHVVRQCDGHSSRCAAQPQGRTGVLRQEPAEGRPGHSGSFCIGAVQPVFEWAPLL